MNLGAFSVSLAVKDIRKSRDFYTALGFEEAGGNIEQNWLILRNGDTVIGLFQGMFERNVLTFNPGWDQHSETLDDFDDVRAIQAELQAKGVTLTTTAEAEGSGPANITLLDPDGNPVLIDQHV
ncbi:VOC family protein [bacterium]|nr:VOC family protein [bacterium]